MRMNSPRETAHTRSTLTGTARKSWFSRRGVRSGSRAVDGSLGARAHTQWIEEEGSLETRKTIRVVVVDDSPKDLNALCFYL